MKHIPSFGPIGWIAIVLVLVGAVNWGLVGAAHFLTSAANWNLVNQLFGSYAWLEHGIYLVVGLAALISIFYLTRMYTASEDVTTSDVEAEPRL